MLSDTQVAREVLSAMERLVGTRPPAAKRRRTEASETKTPELTYSLHFSGGLQSEVTLGDEKNQPATLASLRRIIPPNKAAFRSWYIKLIRETCEKIAKTMESNPIMQQTLVTLPKKDGVLGRKIIEDAGYTVVSFTTEAGAQGKTHIVFVPQ